MATNSLLVLPVLLLGFAAFWCGVVKVIALLGWQRLATHYRVAQLPAGHRHWLSLAYVGFVQYQSVIRASASAEGLALSVIFPFRVGHPPLLIPWQAMGPVQPHKSWFNTTYRIIVRTSGTATVKVAFGDKSFAEALRPWLPLAT